MVTINIGRKEAVFLGAVLLVLIVAGLAVAWGSENPEVMGHSLGEVQMPNCVTGEFLVKTTSGWECGENEGTSLGEEVLSGTLCGMKDTVGNTFLTLCDGHDPEEDCPDGYTSEQVYSADNNPMYSCVKN